MLAMARVLVDAPKVLIADELSLGLAPTIVDQTYRSLEKFREAGPHCWSSSSTSPTRWSSATR